MKCQIAATCLLILSATPLLADPVKVTVTEKKAGEKWSVEIDRFPTTVDEFKEMRDELAKSPQGAMAAFVIAMKVWGENEDLGFQVLPLVLDKSLLVETEDMVPAAHLPNYKGWQVGKEILDLMKTSAFKKEKTYAALPYFEGTSPDTGYKLPAGPYRFLVRSHSVKPSDESEWRGFLNTSGASRPKPYWVKANDKGVWKMLKSSSFFAGTIPPAKKSDDDDL